MNEETAKTVTPKEIAEFCAAVADDRKGTDIQVMDLTKLSAVASYFVICTGTSSPHIRAIAERIERDAWEKIRQKCRIDGTPESNWMIVDFGSVMVHVFTKESRELYDLESLWGDAPKLDTIRKLEKKALSSRLR